MTFISEDAGYRNTLGVYKIESPAQADGSTADVITDVRIIWSNASAEGAGGTLKEGVSTVALDNLHRGDRFGFFLQTNGAAKVMPFQSETSGQLSAAGQFELRNLDGTVATLDSTAPRLVATNGTAETSDDTDIGRAAHTEAVGGRVKLNFSPQPLSQAVAPDGSAIYFGMEDIGNETTFNDLVFRLNIRDVPESAVTTPIPEPAAAQPTAAEAPASAAASTGATETTTTGLIVQTDDRSRVVVRTHDLRAAALGIPQNVTAAQLADESFLANLDVSLDGATRAVRSAQADQGLSQANLDAEGARAVAGRTRQLIGAGSLALSAHFESSILQLFRR